MDELDEILRMALPIMQEKLGYPDSVFNLWFSDLKLVDLREDVAYFTTGTKLRKKILPQRYSEVIADALCQVIGFEVSLSFELAEGVESMDNTTIIFTDPEEESEEDRDKRAGQMKELVSSEKSSGVLDGYTFDNFVEGDSNKMALALCRGVAIEPSCYNPLFIYGRSGLGKTHLLAAVVNYIKKNSPHLKIVYKKSEEFINELVAAIASGTTLEFKEKYRSADVLLIDDIQFIAGKESMQVEFFHTFSTLYEAEKQIILTSDRPPKEIQPLEERIRTRFESGYIVDVQPPSYELRLAIIKKKAGAMGLILTLEQMEYIAERLNNDIRQIEGVLKKLHAISTIGGITITTEEIERVISIVDPGNVSVDEQVKRILCAVAKFYGVSVEDITGKKRTADITKARHIAIYFIKQRIPQITLKAIGAVFKRDHTTIMASITKVETESKTVKKTKAEIEAILRDLKGQV